MINQEYFQLWKEVVEEIDLWEQLMKLHLESYLNTQDTNCLTALIEAAQILIREKNKEQEYYQKMFNE